MECIEDETNLSEQIEQLDKEKNSYALELNLLRKELIREKVRYISLITSNLTLHFNLTLKG